MKQHFHLYLDDSGSRQPDHIQKPVRDDGMDYFALGGILIAESDLYELLNAHAMLCKKWDINYPLHSSRIRGRRQSFAWLGADLEKEAAFLADISTMLTGLPTVGIACVIDRKGYRMRYEEKYGGQPWLMCKTAFSIVIERTAKYVNQKQGTFEIFFEQAGKKEDRDIKNYLRVLKQEGMPFSRESANSYGALSAEDFKRIIKGEPREKTKRFPPIQIADLMLYPMIKGGYDKEYTPYQALMKTGRLIDSSLSDTQRALCGIKYSCFDWIKEGPEKPGLHNKRLA